MLEPHITISYNEEMKQHRAFKIVGRSFRYIRHMSIFQEGAFLACFMTTNLKNVRHLTTNTTEEISIREDLVRS